MRLFNRFVATMDRAFYGIGQPGELRVDVIADVPVAGAEDE